MARLAMLERLVPADGERRHSAVSGMLQQFTKQRKSTVSSCDTEDCPEKILTMRPSRRRRRVIARLLESFGRSRRTSPSRTGASTIEPKQSHSARRHASPIGALDDDAAIERTTDRPKQSAEFSQDGSTLQKLGECDLLLPLTSARRSHDFLQQGLPSRWKKRQLSSVELQLAFAGAPRFSMTNIDHDYRPEVTTAGFEPNQCGFRSCDFAKLEHASFYASTLDPEQCAQSFRYRPSGIHDMFHEIPNMAKANGIEPGTTSFNNFLHLPVSDNSSFSPTSGSFEKRRLLHRYPERFGMKMPSLDVVIERLTELSVLHTAYRNHKLVSATVNEQRVSDFGEHLFTKFLSVPKAVGTSNIPLRAQIESLQTVLGLTGLWYDFGLPNVRLRAGQVMWSTCDASKGQVVDKPDLEPSNAEVLLLQVMLASELLLRLQIVEALAYPRARASPVISTSEAEDLQSQRSVKVNWDLVFATTFLRGVEVSTDLPLERHYPIDPFSIKLSCSDSENTEVYFLSKVGREQVSGLLHFAAVLQWPHEEELRSALQSSASESLSGDDVSVYTTPTQSPEQLRTTETRDYFSITHSIIGRRSPISPPCRQRRQPPGMLRNETLQYMQLRDVSRRQMSNVKTESPIGTWLSRSWLCGLVMPGDCASHFLMSALLEYSPKALQAIGDMANLRTGFVYQGQSFWSKKSVVGRVMAAANGANECMGWISVPRAIVGQNEGWVSLKTLDVPHCNSSLCVVDREAIARNSDPLGSAGLGQGKVARDDFTYPQDELPVEADEAKFEGLRFDSSELTSASAALLTFASPSDESRPSLDIPLTYNVHFVSSHPCERHTLGSARHLLQIQQTQRTKGEDIHGDYRLSNFPSPDTTRGEFGAESLSPSDAVSCSEEAPKCHPLHRTYAFKTIPVATLLSASSSERLSKLSVSRTERDSRTDNVAEVSIWDCRGTKDLELLARAWCANIGENAVVASCRRSCLSCSIREAKALGIGVVIRI